MEPFAVTKNTISDLLIEGEELSTLADNEWKHMRWWYFDRSKENSKDTNIRPPSDWMEFRRRYEKWYRSCIGLMKASDFSGLNDFTSLYQDEKERLVAIKTALLSGFSLENWYGFSVRFENQIAILHSFEDEFRYSINDSSESTVHSKQYSYVDLGRLKELRSITSSQFDLLKLICLCEELNACYSGQCFLATAILVRPVLDHVPPIFSCKSFAEVSSNYSSGSKSFKQAMEHLNSSSRKIADAFLHGQIRSKEILPNKTQVNLSSDLDVLLSEIVRLLK